MSEHSEESADRVIPKISGGCELGKERNAAGLEKEAGIRQPKVGLGFDRLENFTWDLSWMTAGVKIGSACKR